MFLPQGNGHQVIIGLGLEEVVLQDHSRSYNSNNFSADEPLGLRGLFHLFADGDLESPVNQLLNVTRGRVVRDSAEGNRVFLALIPGS